MIIPIYQIDTFSNKIFGGNPAAVCPLKEWLDDDILQCIALENNLSETAFYVKKGDQYELRWFTPKVEVDLCGHATLASAYVLFSLENHQSDKIEFHSPRSGDLTVTKEGNLLTLNFPRDEVSEIEMTPELLACFESKPRAALKGKTDFMLVFENEDQIKNLNPSFESIAKLNCRGLIATARGNHVDFVSKFFAPQCGINEDPVTGSAHTTLTPYWSKVLGKEDLIAVQLSERRGDLKCKYLGDRVEIGGEARLYMTGSIEIE
ncbi:MAG: PhzF family phenazine biosynthesis protein [Bacteroidota bacterium]